MAWPAHIAPVLGAAFVVLAPACLLIDPRDFQASGMGRECILGVGVALLAVAAVALMTGVVRSVMRDKTFLVICAGAFIANVANFMIYSAFPILADPVAVVRLEVDGALPDMIASLMQEMLVSLCISPATAMAAWVLFLPALTGKSNRNSTPADARAAALRSAGLAYGSAFGLAVRTGGETQARGSSRRLVRESAYTSAMAKITNATTAPAR